MQALNKPLVIFDLNGVLLESTHHKHRALIPYDAMARKKYVYFRPGVREFLAWALHHPAFDVAIWTSNIRANADALVSLLFTETQKKRLKFVYCRDECKTFPDYSSIKPIERVLALGYSLGSVLFCDDSPEKMSQLGKRCVHVVPSYSANDPAQTTEASLEVFRKLRIGIEHWASRQTKLFAFDQSPSSRF